MKESLPSAKLLAASACLFALLPVHAQTSQMLKSLVANHGSLGAGDVVFTKFRLPPIPPNLVVLLGDTFPALPDGADVSVQASVALMVRSTWR